MASGKRQRTTESSLSFDSLPIHFERGFNEKKLFEYAPIVQLFTTAGIKSMMVRKPKLANITLVREFYASWDKTGVDSAKVVIRGIPFTVTPTLIRKTLGLSRPPRDSPDFFQVSAEIGIASDRYNEMAEYLFTTVPRGGALNSGSLKREFILLNLFLKFDLYPSSSYSTITTRDLVLLYWIATGQLFDVADVIFRMLGGTVTSAREFLSQQFRQKVQLIYPYLITRICEALGVPVFPTDHLVTGRAPLSYDTVKKSLAARGKGSEASTTSHAPAPVQPATHTPPLPPSDVPTDWTPQMFGDRLYALETGFHMFHTQYRSDQERLTAQMDQFHMSQTQIRSQMDQFLQYQQYIASALHEMRPGSATPPFHQPPSPPPAQQDPPPPPPPPSHRQSAGEEEVGSSDTETDDGEDEDVEATGTDDEDDGDDDDQ